MPSSTATLWRTGRGADCWSDLVRVSAWLCLYIFFLRGSLRLCTLARLASGRGHGSHTRAVFLPPRTGRSPGGSPFDISHRIIFNELHVRYFISSHAANELHPAPAAATSSSCTSSPSYKKSPLRQPPASSPPQPHNGRPTSAMTLTMLAGPAEASTLGCHLSRAL